MSTSDLYILNRKSTRRVARFLNGWGSGPCIWDHLASKYLPQFNFTDFDRDDYVGHDRKYAMVWELHDEITEAELVALQMTFDRAFVPIDDLMTAGEACIAAHGMIEAHGFWTGVNHWQNIGNKLIELADHKFHPQARGIALSCTSVSDPWLVPRADFLDNAWPIFEDEDES
jgi:hypothetical protein